VRTDRGLDRLVAFLDAVVAIAITLLVLPLIELVGVGPHDDLAGLLREHLAELGSFALSFVVIARLWTAHHRLIEQVGSYDRSFVRVNLAWAFTIVVLPFSTQVIPAFGTERLSVGLYIGTIAAATICLSALAVLLDRRPDLRRSGIDYESRSTESLVTAGLVVLALVLGVALPAVNFYALLLLVLTDPVMRLVQRARHRR